MRQTFRGSNQQISLHPAPSAATLIDDRARHSGTRPYHAEHRLWKSIMEGSLEGRLTPVATLDVDFWKGSRKGLPIQGLLSLPQGNRPGRPAVYGRWQPLRDPYPLGPTR